MAYPVFIFLSLGECRNKRGYGSRTQFCQNPRQKQDGNWHTSLIYLSFFIQYLSSLLTTPFLIYAIYPSLLPQLRVKFLAFSLLGLEDWELAITRIGPLVIVKAQSQLSNQKPKPSKV